MINILSQPHLEKAEMLGKGGAKSNVDAFKEWVQL